MLFLRAAPLILLVLTVIYASTYFYLRDGYRDRLEETAEGTDPAFVAARVRTYAARLRRRLALAVYAVPLAVMALAILIMESL